MIQTYTPHKCVCVCVCVCIYSSQGGLLVDLKCHMNQVYMTDESMQSTLKLFVDMW